MSVSVSQPSTDDENYLHLLHDLSAVVETEGPLPSQRERDPDSADLEGPLRAPPRSRTPISPGAIDLLIAAEVSSPAVYTARYTHPIWPGGQSGVTIGIGYDVGTVNPDLLGLDWTGALDAPTITRLAAACGVLGPQAQRLLPGLRSITIDFATANRVFMACSVPQFVAATEAALKNTVLLSPDSLGALVSLTYNRGPAFNRPEDRFREMRAIRDHMADRRFDLIPAELRSMKRIWADDPKLKGLVLRREAEAQLFERGLRAGASGHEAPLAGIAAEESVTKMGVELPGLSTVIGWLRPIVEEPTRDHVIVRLARPGAEASRPVERDADYVAVRVLSARIVNARRWTSAYHGAVHATSSMLYEGAGQARIERQAVLAPDGFRDLDPKGQGKLLQVNRPLFGPMPYRGDLRLAIALFSVKSTDLAGPYLQLIGDLSQAASAGFVAAALPFIGPVKTASDLLFGTSDTASLECGTVRGFEPLETGTWASIGATRAQLGDTGGLQLEPETFRLLDGEGRPVEDYPYLVFEIAASRHRENWMEVPALKASWDTLSAAIVAGRTDEATEEAATFRRLCLTGGDLTDEDAAALAKRAKQRLAVLKEETEAPVAIGSLRSLDLYGPEA